MTVDNIGMLVAFQHEFQGRPAEKGKPLPVIIVSVKFTSVEEVVIGVRFYEKTLQTIDKAEIDIAMKMLIVERDPQITVCLLKSPDAVKTHAVVKWQNNLYSVAPHLKLPTQALNNVSQSTDLGYRSTLWGNHHDKHAVLASVVYL